MGEETKVKVLPAQPVLSIRSKVQVAQMTEFFGDAFSKLFTSLASLGEAPIAPPLALYHGAPSEEGFDVEACVPTGEVLPESGDIKAHELPGGEFASIVRAGPYDQVGEAYGALMAWMGEQGFAPAGPSREIYIVGMGQAEPADYVTEILIPVEKV
jgi:effector-binding domain-containing protein